MFRDQVFFVTGPSDRFFWGVYVVEGRLGFRVILGIRVGEGDIFSDLCRKIIN